MTKTSPSPESSNTAIEAAERNRTIAGRLRETAKESHDEAVADCRRLQESLRKAKLRRKQSAETLAKATDALIEASKERNQLIREEALPTTGYPEADTIPHLIKNKEQRPNGLCHVRGCSYETSQICSACTGDGLDAKKFFCCHVRTGRPCWMTHFNNMHTDAVLGGDAELQTETRTENLTKAADAMDAATDMDIPPAGLKIEKVGENPTKAADALDAATDTDIPPDDHNPLGEEEVESTGEKRSAKTIPLLGTTKKRRVNQPSRSFQSRCNAKGCRFLSTQVCSACSGNFPDSKQYAFCASQSGRSCWLDHFNEVHTSISLKGTMNND